MSDKIKLGVMVRSFMSGIAFITEKEFSTEAEALEWANRQVKQWVMAENAISYRTVPFKLDGTKDRFPSIQDEMRLTGDNGKSEFWCAADIKTRLKWVKARLETLSERANKAAIN